MNTHNSLGDAMTNLTLSVSSELYGKMLAHPEYKWSEVARKAIEEKLAEAELLEDLKAIAQAQKAHKAGKTLTHKQLLRELGLENAI